MNMKIYFALFLVKQSQTLLFLMNFFSGFEIVGSAGVWLAEKILRDGSMARQ